VKSALSNLGDRKGKHKYICKYGHEKTVASNGLMDCRVCRYARKDKVRDAYANQGLKRDGKPFKRIFAPKEEVYP
jgi:hypothetical protein